VPCLLRFFGFAYVGGVSAGQGSLGQSLRRQRGSDFPDRAK
jgi:hypothetical protein